MPLTIRYKIEQFKQVGVALPTNGWTVDQFIDTLKALKAAQPDEKPFYPYFATSGEYLFLLIAAYGALPIDWRTDPPGINYTDPQTVDAIRQVLDLAKNGYIQYDPAASYVFNLRSASKFAIFVDSPFSSSPNDVSGLGRVTFPTGATYTPISYTLSAAFISAKTASPEACYRWIRSLAGQTELFDGMPTLRSVIDAARTEAVEGAEATRLFEAFADQMNAPNAYVIHSRSEGIGSASMWLLRAFDNYVLRGADLEAELKEAELYTKAYLACIATPEAEADERTPGTIFVDEKCANKVDPTFIDSLFPSKK
jgi:ABC-type glycerol-3-phosphate transport system substrate-binding protein